MRRAMLQRSYDPVSGTRRLSFEAMRQTRPMEPGCGPAHSFSQMAVQFHGDTPREGEQQRRNPPRNPTPQAPQRPAQHPKTPDGVDVGPNFPRKTFCPDGSMSLSHRTANNDAQRGAQGAQEISFQGKNTGTVDGKTCSCDCGLYRQYIRGHINVTPAGGRTTAVTDFGSCGVQFKLDPSTFVEEATRCIQSSDHDPANCKFHFGDQPGSDKGRALPDGVNIDLVYDFQYEVWDVCQGRSVEKKAKSFSIQGDRSPRRIRWT